MENIRKLSKAPPFTDTFIAGDQIWNTFYQMEQTPPSTFHLPMKSLRIHTHKLRIRKTKTRHRDFRQKEHEQLDGIL